MEKEPTTTRRRRKGTLSVLDEFSDNGAGEILFVPRLSLEELAAIEKKTKAADVPSVAKQATSLTHNGESSEPTTLVTGQEVEPNVSQTRAKVEPQLIDNMTTPLSVEKSEGGAGGDLDFGPKIDVAEFHLNKPIEPSPLTPLEVADSSSLESLGKILEPKLSQSEAKHKPNLGQSRAKVEPTHKPKLSQQGQQLEPMLRKVEPKLKPQPEPDLSRTEAKVEPFGELESLVGLQRRCLLYVYETCRSAGNKLSPLIHIQNFAVTAESTVAAVRKAVQRLEEKGFLERAVYKDGRGGGTRYRLPDLIYNQLLLAETRAKVEPNISQTRVKVEPEPEPKLKPTPPSSSRDLYLNNSSTTQQVETSDNEWLEYLDLSDVNRFGITRDVIIRARQLNSALEPEQIEDLVFRFGQFAKDPKNGVKNARGFFLDLAKQVSGGSVPLGHIETPRERLMREIVQREKEAQAQRSQVERDFWEHSFKEWLGKLSREQRDELVPPVGIVASGNIAQTQKLKEIFERDERPRIERELQALELKGNA